MEKNKTKTFLFVCNHTELTRYTLFAAGFFLIFLLFVISPSEPLIYYLSIIILLMLGSTLMVVSATLDSIINRIQFSNEEKTYDETNRFHEIDEYNKYISASFADKVMFINHLYDSICFKNAEKSGEHCNHNTPKHNKQKTKKKRRSNTDALMSKLTMSNAVKTELSNPGIKKDEPKARIKQIDNTLMQALGLRRQFLVHRKAKTQILDEFTKQLIIVAFIKFIYDNTSANFVEDKKNALLIGFVLAVITYGIYFFFIRGKKRPDENYHLLEYEIKKIDSLITDVDTPDDWDLKKKQQAENSPRKTIKKKSKRKSR